MITGQQTSLATKPAVDAADRSTWYGRLIRAPQYVLRLPATRRPTLLCQYVLRLSATAISYGYQLRL
eukprot:1002566-Rhodomonas_salina.1